MSKQRLAILIVAGLGVLATFMPWVSIPIVGTVNGTKADGWITLALFAVPLVISLLNDRTKQLKGGLLYGAIIPSIIAGVIGISKIVDFNSSMSELGDNPFAAMFGVTISIEFGLYLVVVAGFALPILAFLIKDKVGVTE
jgi:hypothetical protein